MKRPQTILLVIPSDACCLKIVRSVLESVGQLFDFSDQDIHAMELASNEACANIINHAYHDNPNHTIEIKIIAQTDKFQIELRDTGQKVDPEKIKPRELEDVRPGGLGVHLMRSLMDQVIFDQEYQEGNRLILIKERSKSDDANT